MVTFPTTCTTILTKDVKVQYISPLFSSLIGLNSYKELEIWSVALESIHHDWRNPPLNMSQLKVNGTYISFLQTVKTFLLPVVFLFTNETLALFFTLSFPSLGLSLFGFLGNVLLIIIMGRTWRIFYCHKNTYRILKNSLNHLKLFHQF